MAGGASTFVANEDLDNRLGNTSYDADCEIGLLIGLPAAGGAGLVELSTGGYARLTVANDATTWPAASGGLKRNGIAFEWDPFTDDLPPLLGAAVWGTDGELWYWGPFGSAREVLEDEPFVIPALGGTFKGHA